jgi:formamidopyrimidine-DNA glycosylase
MPELPEVETTRRGIEPWLVGRRIERLVVRQPRLRWRVPRGLPAKVRGARIRAVARRAKYLLVETDAGTLILHLGMSGSLRILDAESPPLAHDHFDLVLDSGRCLRFNDPRRFGCLLFTTGEPARHRLLANLAVEPLSGSFTGEALWRRARGRRVSVKAFIMDSRIVAGVGNIYASEALFRAGIRPGLAAGRVSRARMEALVAAIRDVLNAAIGSGDARLLPAAAVRLRAHRPALPALPHADPTVHAGSAQHLLVPALPALGGPAARAQRLGDDRMDELGDVAPEQGDFAHQRRRDEGELLLRGHEHVVHVPRQVAAHVGELELELEVRNRAQAAHHDAAALLACEVDSQAGVAEHRHVGQVRKHLLRQLDPLGECEQRRLARVGRDPDHDAVEDAGGTPQQVLVPVGDGIEGPRIDGAALVVHSGSPSPWRRAR